MLAVNASFLLALRSVARNHNITNFDTSDTLPNTFDHTGSLMAEDARETTLRIAAIQPVNICMAECVGDDFDPDLPFLGGRHPDIFDFHGLFCSISNGCLAKDRLWLFGVHGNKSLINYFKILIKLMSLYNQVYSEIITGAQTKYKKLHNLFQLRSFRQKINCYKNNPNKPDQYYDCFFEVEGALLQKSQQFVANCEQIDDQYKICLADCKENYKDDAQNKKECYNSCGTKFKNSISFLYDNFYETTVGKEPEYKAAKKQ